MENLLEMQRKNNFFKKLSAYLTGINIIFDLKTFKDTVARRHNSVFIKLWLDVKFQR